MLGCSRLELVSYNNSIHITYVNEILYRIIMHVSGREVQQQLDERGASSVLIASFHAREILVSLNIASQQGVMTGVVLQSHKLL